MRFARHIRSAALVGIAATAVAATGLIYAAEAATPTPPRPADTYVNTFVTTPNMGGNFQAAVLHLPAGSYVLSGGVDLAAGGGGVSCKLENAGGHGLGWWYYLGSGGSVPLAGFVTLHTSGIVQVICQEGSPVTVWGTITAIRSGVLHNQSTATPASLTAARNG